MNIPDAILVTGGAGYIGSHMCKHLHRAGYTPIAYDNLTTGNAHTVKWGPLEHADILDTDHLVHVIQQYQCRAVIHLAASVGVAESINDPDRYEVTNVKGSQSVLSAMQRTDNTIAVLSSTASVYGQAVSLPITEQCVPAPITPYGHSKREMEQLFQGGSSRYKGQSAVLRYFNVVGADPELEIGCERQDSSNLVPRILDVIAGRRSVLEIYGQDYDTPDGTAIRDYIHVSDLVDAHIAALEHLLSEKGDLCLNLGIGKGHSVLEMVAAAERIVQRSIPTTMMPRRAGDPSELWADISKAKEILDWIPTYTSMDDMFKTAWQWEQR